jgi:hypothetical protein
VEHDALARLRQRADLEAVAHGIDANALSRDPMLKLAVGRDPNADSELASQSTISRFENAPSRRERQMASATRRLPRGVKCASATNSSDSGG